MNHLDPNTKEHYSVDFSDVSLAVDVIDNIEFDGCTFDSCDFSETTFRNCKFSDCEFSNSNLNMIKVTNCDFSTVTFFNCKMLAIDWTKAYWRGLSLGSSLKMFNCLISSSSFYGLKQNGVTIQSCRAHDVDFRETQLKNANFSGTDLTNSVFNNTDLTEANFEDAENYDINIKNNQLKKAKFNRFEAVHLLESLGIELID